MTGDVDLDALRREVDEANAREETSIEVDVEAVMALLDLAKRPTPERLAEVIAINDPYNVLINRHIYVSDRDRRAARAALALMENPDA